MLWRWILSRGSVEDLWSMVDSILTWGCFAALGTETNEPMGKPTRMGMRNGCLVSRGAVSYAEI